EFRYGKLGGKLPRVVIPHQGSCLEISDHWPRLGILQKLQQPPLLARLMAERMEIAPQYLVIMGQRPLKRGPKEREDLQRGGNHSRQEIVKVPSEVTILGELLPRQGQELAGVISGTDLFRRISSVKQVP